MINKNKFLFLNAFQKKRLLKNSISGFTGEGLKVLVQFFFAPLMIIFWGVEYFGIWIFLLSIPNMFTIFNINTIDASIQEITIHRSNKDFRKANTVFQNSIFIVILNSLAIFSIILLYFSINGVDINIVKNFLNDYELKAILILLVLSIYLNLFEGIFLSGIYSLGKLYIGFNIATSIDILSKIAIVTSGIFTDQLIYPIIIFFISTLIRFILNFYFFKINSNDLKFSFKLVSKKKLKNLIKLSIGHTSDIISNIIRHSGVIIILGIYFEPYIVGYVATVKTLFYFLPVRFFGKLSHISLYEYADLYSKKKYGDIKKNIVSSAKLILLLILLFFLISIIFGPYIYNFWLSGKYKLEILFLTLVVLDASFFTIREFLISFMRSINKYNLLGLSELLIITISLILFYYLINFNKNYINGFFILSMGSLTSLVYGIYILYNYLKKI